MNTLRDPDAILGAWLDDGPATLPAETRQAIAVGIRTATRQRPGIGRPSLRLPTFDLRRLWVALGSAAVIVVAAALTLNFVNRQGGIGALSSPTPSSATASPSTSPRPTAPPSEEPYVGQLVLNLQSWRAGFHGVAVYADGRVIWVADERVGYLEQRLTPEGVERLRSRAISTGLFERDLALGIDAVGFGAFEVRRGDRTAIVTWGSGPVDVSSRVVEARFVRASPAQALEVRELEAFLRDPTTWGLPDDMYVQREITPFVPSYLWVSYDRGAPDLSNLPSPAREVVTRILEPALVLDGCISIDQALEMANVLAEAGIIEPDYDVARLGLAFDVGRSFVHIHPALPHLAECDQSGSR